ncbi:MAG: hypothetical protein FJY62_05810 [Betaproteobacteria bacterium]|jgi:hypothetical protein|nr:hypothetical protein [Betaproteobacteria bacterium]
MTVGNAGASDAVSQGTNIFTDDVLNKHQRAEFSQKRYEKELKKLFLELIKPQEWVSPQRREL